MINLLPPQEKIALLKDHRKKLALVLCFVFLISLACFILMLLALYFYILMQISFQKSLLDDAKAQYQTTDFIKYKNLIGQYNVTLSKADDFYKKEVYFSEALKVISSIEKPATVHLKSIALEPSKSGFIKTSISGVANVRENLLLFKKSLEAEKRITAMYFPPDNWIKPTDITFFVTFEISSDNHDIK